MTNEEMSTDECLKLLTRSTVFRLAAARDNQPYIVPVFLVCDEAAEGLYGFTTLGQKVKWMRANPLVCVQVDEISAADRWMSVVVYGRYEEMSQPTAPADDLPGRAPERAAESLALGEPSPRRISDEKDFKKAFKILEGLPAWWRSGTAAWTARVRGGSNAPFHSIFFRIKIDRISGRCGRP